MKNTITIGGVTFRGPNEHEMMLRRIVEASGERRLTNKTMRAIADAVVDECVALVLPAVENQWGGDVLLRKLRALKSGAK